MEGLLGGETSTMDYSCLTSFIRLTTGYRSDVVRRKTLTSSGLFTRFLSVALPFSPSHYLLHFEEITMGEFNNAKWNTFLDTR